MFSESSESSEFFDFDDPRRKAVIIEEEEETWDCTAHGEVSFLPPLVILGSCLGLQTYQQHRFEDV